MKILISIVFVSLVFFTEAAKAGNIVYGYNAHGDYVPTEIDGKKLLTVTTPMAIMFLPLSVMIILTMAITLTEIMFQLLLAITALIMVTTRMVITYRPPSATII